MSKAVTIRSVPEAHVRALSEKAARAGQSMQEYLRSELGRLAERPDPDLFWAAVRADREDAGTAIDAATILAARNADRP